MPIYKKQPLGGTLDLLVLKTLATGSMDRAGITRHLNTISEHVLKVDGYPLQLALQRLLHKGYIEDGWGASENNRRARYYALTAEGWPLLSAERNEFYRTIFAIQKVLA